MDADDKQLLLAEYLPVFRTWAYDKLAGEIDRTRADHDCLRFIDGVIEDLPYGVQRFLG